jgi:hypothetical protein
MRKLLSIFAFATLACQSIQAQDHYDPTKAPSSEELLLKEDPSKRVFTEPGQRYLALDANPVLGGPLRVRFFAGDNMKFKVKGQRGYISEAITDLTDSTFSIAIVKPSENRMFFQPIPFSQVRRVKKHRRIPWVTEGAFLFPLAGVIYAAADLVNPGVDGRRWTTDASSAWVGGGLVAAGFICYKFSFPSYKIGERNRLKMLQTY